jgi:Ca2+-binding RTX toxin-like protein
MLTEGKSGDNGLTASADERSHASLVLDAHNFDGKLPWPAEALLHADFVRIGDDLVVHLADGETILIQHYFAAAQPVELVSFDGALIPGWLVGLLSAPSVPTQLAAGTGTDGLGEPIGEAHAITGSATVTHANGVTGPLVVGNPIYLNDIVETGDGSAISIVFVDKTTFALADNGRMAIDKLIYDPSGSDNGLGLSVLTGAFVFVTGAIAPAPGDGMTITTPAGSIGIRGTTGGGAVTPEGGVKAWVVQDDDPEQESITFTDNAGHSYKLSEAGSTIDFATPNSTPSLSVQPGNVLLQSVGTIQSVVPSITHTLSSPDNNQPHQEQPQEQQKGENDQPGDQEAAQASQFETAAGSTGGEGSSNVAGDSGSGNFAFFSPTGVTPEGGTGALSGTEDGGSGFGSAGGGPLSGGGSGGSGGALPPTAGSEFGPQFEVLPPPAPSSEPQNPPPPPLPLIDSDAGGDEIVEAASPGAPVGITVRAPQLTGTVTYSLTDDAGGRFAIDSNTGVVTVADGSLLNSEAAGNHSITAQATNGVDTVARSFVVTIADLPPSTPADADGDANSVTENAANGTTVGVTAQAADPNGGVITYSLSDSAGGRFAIDSATGVVTVANGALLDHEAAVSHDITVRAADPFGAASEQTFTIAITGLNESPGTPTDTDAAANQVTENAVTGTAVGVTAKAIDPDGDTVTYSLTNDAGGRFAIDPTSGVVTVANGALLDFESATSHVITVQASSSGAPPSVQNFTIAVTDQNPEANDVTNLHWSISGPSQVNESADTVYTVSYSGATLLPGNTETITAATGAAPSGLPDAIGGVDYIGVDRVLTFTGGGPTAQTLSVHTVDDTLVEGSEDYGVQLSGPSHGTVTSGTVSTVILDNDASNLNWSLIGQTQVSEGADATYTVAYSGAALAPGQTASVTVQTGAAGGGAPNAIGGSDYNNVSIALAFTGGGGTAQTLTVHTNDDTLVEGTEDYQVTIGPVSGGSVATATVVTNIVDNDASNLSWTLSGSTQVGEGAGALYTVSYTGGALAPGQSAFVTLQTGSGTATEAGDFISRDGFLLTFTGGGATLQTVSVTTIEDTLVEATEGYQVTLGTVSAGSVATGTVLTDIVDNDASNLVWSISGQAQVVEGNGASYTVSYAGAALAPGQTAIITVATGPGTNAGIPDAIAGSDYTALDMVLTFTGGGATAQTVSVQTSDDTVIEGTADYSVQIAGPSSGVIAVGTTGTDIVDNDGGSLLWSVGGPGTVAEGAIASYTVGYGGASLAPGETALVTIATDPGTALEGTDFGSGDGQILTFTGGGDATQILTVQTVGDSLVENSETYDVRITAVSTGSVAVGTAFTTILDDDASNLLWSLTGQTQVNEGADAIYTISYSGAALAPGQVQFVSVATGVASGGASDATAVSDYGALNVILTFSAGGATAQTLVVHTVNDTVVEGTEDYRVSIASVTGGAVASGTVATNIVDNDASSLTWAISGSTQVTEGAAATYTVTYGGVTLAGGVTAIITVNTGTLSGGLPDATAGVDYTNLTTVLTFTGGGNTAQTVSVAAIADTLVEVTEDYRVSLSNPTSGTVMTGTVATNIVDNDGPSLLWTITGQTQVTEGADAGYTVSYAGATLAPGQTAFATVQSGTAAGGAPDATGGSDYNNVTSVLTFTGGGATAQTLTVHTNNDTLVETNEDYQVAIGVVSTGTVAVGTAVTDIIDDDATNLAWAITGQAQVNEGADASYTVSYAGAALATGVTASITVATGLAAGGAPNATSGVDFDAVSTVLTFTGGGTTLQILTVHANEDTDVENNEDYSVQIAGPSVGLIAAGTVTTEILGGITGSEVLRGTAGANNLQGHDGDDWIQGLGADDTLQGGPGADTLIGGSGNDRLNGGPGADLYYHSGSLGDGFDTIENATAGDVVTFTGGSFFFDVNFDRVGNDLVIGSALDDNYDFADTGSVTIKDHYAGAAIDKFTIDLGVFKNAYYNDTSLTGLDYAVFVTPGGLIGSDQGGFAEILQGSASGDVILGNGGYHDEIYGGAGNDSIVAGGGNDWLVGNQGNDTIAGGNGDDNLQGREGDDVLIGGNGFDFVWYHHADAGVTASLAAGGASDDGQGGSDNFNGIEGLIGSTHDDSLAGDGNGNRLEGRNGNDTLSGGGGGDTLVGGEGNDRIDGGSGADLYFHSGFLSDGFDTIENATAGDAVIFTGGPFFDLNYDRIGNDLIIGGAVDSNYDFADTGSVTIKDHYAGAAISRFTIDTGFDNNSYYNDPSVLGIGGATFFTPGGLIGTDQGDFAEVLQGTGGSETLLGNGGYHDEIYAGGGNDSIVAGWGNDWLVGADGDDTVNGGNGDDILQGRAGTDLLIGGNGFDSVWYSRAASGVIASLNAGGASNDGYGGTDSYVSIEGLVGSASADSLEGNGGNN